MEAILECNWYTRYCPLNGGVRYREALLYRGYTVLELLLILLNE